MKKENSQYHINVLTISQMREIYENHMIQDFPKSEIKPFEKMRQGVENQCYIAYGLYDQDQILHSYAFFMLHHSKMIALLDYFAVVQHMRKSGIGSCFLGMLHQLFQEKKIQVVLEVENPVYAESVEQQNMQERRIHFYQKNGVKLSAVQCRFITNEYRILYFGDTHSDEEIDTIVRDMYDDFFGRDFVHKYVEFHNSGRTK